MPLRRQGVDDVAVSSVGNRKRRRGETRLMQKKTIVFFYFKGPKTNLKQRTPPQDSKHSAMECSSRRPFFLKKYSKTMGVSTPLHRLPRGGVVGEWHRQ